MKFNPYSLDHAPRTLPIWQTILADLGNPHPAAVAKVLGVGVRTVHRWNREDRAPRVACLALFWLTQWGRSAVNCQAVNDCRVAVGYASALEREAMTLRTKLAHILAIGDFGSANEPASIRRASNVGRR